MPMLHNHILEKGEVDPLFLLPIFVRVMFYFMVKYVISFFFFWVFAHFDNCCVNSQEKGNILWKYNVGDPITTSAYVDEHLCLTSDTSISLGRY